MTVSDIDQIMQRLEAIQKMTNNYEDFLAAYKQGGDWDVHSFMGSISRRAAEVVALVENDQCV